MAKDISVVSVNDLAEAVANSLLNAVERRVSVEDILRRDHAIVIDPIITVGGMVVLARSQQLQGLLKQTSAGGR